MNLARRRLCRCVLLAVTSVLLGMAGWTAHPTWAQGSVDTPSQRMHDALEDYERGHYPQAFAGFARLADQRHPEAARIALQMWLHGAALYRTEFNASALQVELWRHVWGCTGDATRAPCQLALQAP